MSSPNEPLFADLRPGEHPPLDVFLDRRDILGKFAEYLNGSPHQTILFIYGDSGNGKSFLLKFLETYCCKILPEEQWKKVRTSSEEALVDALKRSEIQVPSVRLDFSSQSAGSTQDPVAGLMHLKRGLAKTGLRFPVFDFACLRFLQLNRKLNPEELRNLFPPEEMALASELVAAFLRSKWLSPVNLVLTLFGKYLREEFTVYLKKRKLTPDQLNRIQAMEAPEIRSRLPEWFAKDLNTAMSTEGAPKKVVLFFDTHEAFWGEIERNFGESGWNARDEWVRRLLATLDRSKGIVNVIASRDKPRWKRAAYSPISDDILDFTPLEGLSIADAREFLAKAGVSEPGLVDGLLRYTQVTPGSVHPLFLRVCVELIRAAPATVFTAADFQHSLALASARRVLVERFLTYVDFATTRAVIALSACREFNDHIFANLAHELGITDYGSVYKHVTSFSFVTKSRQTDKPWYQIHKLLRGLLREQEGDLVREADKRLELFYRNSVPPNPIEAIYHLNRSGSERGLREWVDLFDHSVEDSDFRTCDGLLTVAVEMDVESEFDRAEMTRCQGDYLAMRGHRVEAKEIYKQAIGLYDAALAKEVGNVRASSAKVYTLVALSETYLEIAQYSAARRCIEDALEVSRKAVALHPIDIELRNNRATAFVALGDIQSELADCPPAIVSYGQALTELNINLEQAPTDQEALVNKGYCLSSIGEMYAGMGDQSSALPMFVEAIASYDAVLAVHADDRTARNNKAYALVGAAESYASASQNGPAVERCIEAIALYDQILGQSPDDSWAYSNKARALTRLATAQSALYDSNALTSVESALACTEEALRRMPRDTWAHNTKALALLTRSKLQEQEPALDSLRTAVVQCDCTISEAPDDVEAGYLKGLIYKTMAARMSAESRSEKRQYFESANASLKAVIDIAPHNAEVEFESADVLAEIARLDLKEGNPSSALTHGSAAKAALTRAIGLRPSDRRVAQSYAQIDDLLMEIATNSKTNGQAQTA